MINLTKKFFTGIGKSVCYFALYFGAQIIASYIVVIINAVYMLISNPEIINGEKGLQNYIYELSEKALSNTSLILIIAAGMTVGILALVFLARKKRFTREIWLIPVRTSSLWPVIIAGAALSFVICVGFAYIPWPESLLNSYDELYSVAEDSSYIGIIVTILIAPIIEEIIFRGLVFTRLCTGMPAAAALILASTLFGAMHGTLIWAAYGFIGGVCMTLVFMKYRSIIASILFHAVFNLFGGYIIWRIKVPNALVDFAILGAAAAVLAAMGFIMYLMPRERIDIVRRDRLDI